MRTKTYFSASELDDWCREQARRMNLTFEQFMRGALALRAASEAPGTLRSANKRRLKR
jgi:hypothetical protein